MKNGFQTHQALGAAIALIFTLLFLNTVHAASLKNPAMQAAAGIDIPTETPTRTATLTETPTPTPSATATQTSSSPTPRAPNHIVISEFRTTGPLGANDEFIELYNPTGASVNIGHWSINISSACGNSLSALIYIYYGTLLQPGQHYLVAAYADYSSITDADQRFSPGIANNGGLALVSSGTVVNMVGMCGTTFFYEGTTLPPLPVAPLDGAPTPAPGTSNQSYERKPGGATACYDTNNNINDFRLISSADPLDQASTPVRCNRNTIFPIFLPLIAKLSLTGALIISILTACVRPVF